MQREEGHFFNEGVSVQLVKEGRNRYERMEAGKLDDIKLEDYDNRYDTVVGEFGVEIGGGRWEQVFDVSTFVKGKSSPCYVSSLTESGVFTGYIAYKSRKGGKL